MAAKKPKKPMKTVQLDIPVPKSPTRTVTKAGMPGFFRKVESNVKGGVSVPLSTCTAVVSDKNRAGKTAVLDSFRLALTGQHPIGPHAVDLVGLTADGSTPWATLTGETAGADLRFPSGKKTPSFSLSGDLASMAKKADQLLPLVAMRDLLTLGTSKAREELFRRFGVPATLPVPASLDGPQVKVWEEALAASQGDVVERLSAAGTWVRSHKRGLSAQLKALEEEKDRLHSTQSNAGAPTDDALRALEEKLAAHQKYAQTAALRTAVEEAKSRLGVALAAYEANPAPGPLEAFQQELDACAHRWGVEAAHKEVEQAQQRLLDSQKTARLYSLIHQLRQRLATDGCLACGGQVHGDTGPLVAAAEKLVAGEMMNVKACEQSLAEAEEVYNVTTESRDRELDTKHAERLQQQQRHAAALNGLKAAKTEYERLAGLVEASGGAEAPAESEAALREQLAALQAARVEAGRAVQLAADIRALKAAQSDAKAVEAVLGDTLNALVATVKEQAETAVNRWMPEGFKAALALEDSDGKPTCRWEIVGSDGRPHPRGAASGAEWSALTVAIACAWSEGQPYRFLLLDDADIAGFSAANVRNLLDTVSAAVRDGRLTQALVAWSRPGEIPDEGWSVVAL